MGRSRESGGVRGPRVLVIGGANTDIVGVSDERVVAAESNPGHVRISAGGVGCNVAANLARMGASVSLLTAFGDDAHARSLADECRVAGIDCAHSITVDDTPGPVYLAIVDSSGDLVTAVSDMRAIEALTPEVLMGAFRDVAHVDAVVIDANLAVASIEAALVFAVGVPVFADAVSMAKAPRLRGFLGQLTVLRANAAEAEVLTGFGEPARAAEALVERGVGTVWVSAGRAGTWWASGGESGFVSAPVAEVVNVTGAGDAFMAGVVFATLTGWGSERVARFATGAAALTLASEQTVSPHMNVDNAATAGERVVT